MAKLACLGALGLILWALPTSANLEGDQWVFHLPDGTDAAFNRLGDIRGSPLVSLESISKKLGLEIRPVPKTKKFLVHNPKNQETAELTDGRTQVKGFWGTIELSRAPMVLEGQYLVPIDIGDRLLRPLLTKEAPAPLPTHKSLFENDVILDAGHGGNDFGAYLTTDTGVVREKDLVLEFVLDLKKALEARGLKVATTRDKDVYLTLHERTVVANRQQARLFLSFHLNADVKKKGKGFEIYLLSLKSDETDVRSSIARENQMIPSDLPEGVDRALANLRAEAHFEESLTWAKRTQKLLRKEGKPSGRGIKMGPFYVLYGVEMPALLVELGYLTSDEDRTRLRSPLTRHRLTESLASGLADALKKGRTGPTP